jgi:hypothetical protein
VRANVGTEDGEESWGIHLELVGYHDGDPRRSGLPSAAVLAAGVGEKLLGRGSVGQCAGLLIEFELPELSQGGLFEGPRLGVGHRLTVDDHGIEQGLDDDWQVISLRSHSVPASCTCSPHATAGAIVQRRTVRAPSSKTGPKIIIDSNEDDPTYEYCPRGAHNRYTERKLLEFKQLKLKEF